MTVYMNELLRKFKMRNLTYYNYKAIINLYKKPILPIIYHIISKMNLNNSLLPFVRSVLLYRQIYLVKVGYSYLVD
ncbi:hypothetical protein V1477_005240 [Vespula maculifrons]|uniref:Uncharacterized protein n=1 Tax=Vespula maculifrons TaxID=7453 RepID=A0ABD2CP37_VESMC